MSDGELLARARASDPEVASIDPRALAAAIDRLTAGGATDTALELLGRLGRRFLVTNELALGARLAASLVEAPGTADVQPWRARVLCFDGIYAFRQGDRARSVARNQEALALARRTGDLVGEGEALTGLARLALRDGDYRRVVEIATAARERALAAGDEAASAPPLHLLSAGTRMLGDYPAARDLYLDGLALNRRLGNAAWIAMEEHNLGWVELHLGDAAAAARRFDGNGAPTDPFSEAWSTFERAGVAFVAGDRPVARRLFDDAAQQLARLDRILDPDDQFEVDWLRSRLETEA